MNRRDFFRATLATAGGILLPYEPERVYSFARELRVPGSEVALVTDGPVVLYPPGATVSRTGRKFSIDVDPDGFNQFFGRIMDAEVAFQDRMRRHLTARGALVRGSGA